MLPHRSVYYYVGLILLHRLIVVANMQFWEIRDRIDREDLGGHCWADDMNPRPTVYFITSQYHITLHYVYNYSAKIIMGLIKIIIGCKLLKYVL